MGAICLLKSMRGEALNRLRAHPDYQLLLSLDQAIREIEILPSVDVSINGAPVIDHAPIVEETEFTDSDSESRIQDEVEHLSDALGGDKAPTLFDLPQSRLPVFVMKESWR